MFYSYSYKCNWFSSRFNKLVFPTEESSNFDLFELHMHTYYINFASGCCCKFYKHIKQRNDTGEDRTDVATIILFKMDKCPVIYGRERTRSINKREINGSISPPYVHVDAYIVFRRHRRDIPDDRLAKDSEGNPKD